MSIEQEKNESTTALLPQQLFVYGQGIEPIGSDEPGNIVEGSFQSGISFYLAVMTGVYCKKHPEVENVVFSGRAPVWMPRKSVPEGSMAERMKYVAQYLGERAEGKPSLYKTETSSWTDYEGLALSVRAQLLNPDLVTGIFVRSRLRKRALRIARMVLPETTWVPIIAEDAYKTSDVVPRVGAIDPLLHTLERWVMRDVMPGDIEEILLREQCVQQAISNIVEAGDAVKRFLMG